MAVEVEDDALLFQTEFGVLCTNGQSYVVVVADKEAWNRIGIGGDFGHAFRELQDDLIHLIPLDFVSGDIFFGPLSEKRQGQVTPVARRRRKLEWHITGLRLCFSADQAAGKDAVTIVYTGLRLRRQNIDRVARILGSRHGGP